MPVVHVAGNIVGSKQYCSRCGIVLRDASDSPVIWPGIFWYKVNSEVIIWPMEPPRQLAPRIVIYQDCYKEEEDEKI